MNKCKMFSKVLILSISIILLSLIVNSNSVKATTSSQAEITIMDSAEKSKGYFQPLTGGSFGAINLDDTYDNCTYFMGTQHNYGEKIETPLGTFTFKEELSEDNYWNDISLINNVKYLYTCKVDNARLKEVVNKYYVDNNSTLKINFSGTNIESNEQDTINAEMLAYKRLFKEKANLKIGNVDFIKDGKVIKGQLRGENDECFVVYNEVTNELGISNYDCKVIYSNMGDSFKINKMGTSDVETICEDGMSTEDDTVNISSDNTDIKLVSNTTIIPADIVLKTAVVTNQTTLNTVKESLKEISTKYITYDIILASNNVAIQPNGKVKISIPIPSDYDKTKVEVYRVAEDGTKTKYDVTVEGEYATIETDHFSTYVLAEKNVTEPSTNTEKEVSPTERTTMKTTKRGEKDNTPKTGTVDIVSYVAIITIISFVGIVILKRKF